MKKSFVALSVIGALAAIWTGSSWYTGKIIEEKIEERLTLVNTKLAEVDASEQQIKFDKLHVERGVFSSKVTYELVGAFSNTAFTVPFESTLYHGPIPLDRLGQFDIMPVLLSSHDRVVQNATTQPWFDYAQGRLPFESQIKIHYDSTFTGKAQIAPAKLALTDAEIMWKGIDFDFDQLTDEGIGKLQMMINELNVAIRAKEQPSNSLITLNNIKIESDLQTSEWERIPVGKQVAQIDNMRVSLKDPNRRDFNLEYRNLFLDSSTKKTEQFVNYELVTKIPEMLVNGQLFGQLDANLTLAHIEGSSMNKLLKLIENEQVESIAFEEQLEALSKTILDNRPLLQIEPLKLTSEAGELTGNMIVEIANGNWNLLEQGKVLALFKQLAMNIHLEKQALVRLFTVLNQANGMTKEQASDSAEQTITLLFAEAIQNGVLVSNEQSLNLALLLENNALKLNGQEIPEEQVLMMIVLFLFGMGY